MTNYLSVVAAINIFTDMKWGVINATEPLGGELSYNMTWADLVRKIFEQPDMGDDEVEAILGGCTGFPIFWLDNPVRECVSQLRHAKRSLARGFSIDQIYMEEDVRLHN
jgi:hypothetical protein